MLWEDERFKRFLKRRQQLNERLDKTRGELDEWLAANEPDGAVSELAFLEGSLQGRRRLLDELSELDEQIIVMLIEIRTGARQDEKSSG